ncbi:MAG TPA: DUF6468 domain-containing protein [Xanthobacteraceae bacterium]|nr:DUF6468 domain-containing protein [Xanthobacteraceae bacterium]
MSQGLGMLIDCVVAILLVLTIGYCMMLNRRLKLLKADEQSLRATISELVTATEIAERAIGGLKITVHECDMGLGERLRKAERLAGDLDRAVVSGKDLISRLSQIVSAGRRADDAAKSAEPRGAGQAAPAKAESKIEDIIQTKVEGMAAAKAAIKTDAKAVAAAAEAFAERLRMKVHGLAA